jgi:hypothetical protein
LVRLRSESHAPVPVRRKKTGAQMLVIHRVKKRAIDAVARRAGLAEEVPRMVERHDDHDDATNDVDGFQARAFEGDGFGYGGHLARSLSSRLRRVHHLRTSARRPSSSAPR